MCNDQGRQGLPVAIVDDSDSVRAALTRLLTVGGFDPVAFPSAEALLAGPLHRYACFILDIQLPALSGWELQQALATMGLGSKCIFITAHDATGNESRSRKAGAAAYFAKPFSGRRLLQAVRSVACT